MMSGDETKNSHLPEEDRMWKANEDFVQEIMSLGVSRSIAERALFYTGNQSAELAASWIFENPDLNSETASLQDQIDDEEEEGSDGDEEEEDNYKMIFVVNTDLKMGVGKVAAQVAHACIGMHRLCINEEGKYGEMLLIWEDTGETKIVCQGDNAQHLQELEKQAKAYSLPTYLVHDAGKTQIPSGSISALCIFGKVEIVDRITRKLKLL